MTFLRDSDMNELADRMEELVERLREGQIDIESRQRLLVASQKLAVALETPLQACRRVAFLPLESSMVRCAIDLGIFGMLAESTSALTTSSLSKAADVHPAFLERLLRYLASMKYIEETVEGHWGGTSVCTALACMGFAAGVKFYFDIAGQVFSKIPAWLRIHKTQDFAAELEAPFQFAVGNTKESFFPWLAKYESSLADFHAWMNSRQSGEHHWLDTYPMEQFLDKKKAESNTNKESTRVLMVDIGGGNGHESRLVKTKYPDLSGSIIFQDLTEVIEKCPSAPGVEGVVHDFFSPQPIHGARIYRLHHILHDWKDEQCLLILGHIKEAMDAQSILQIGDVVLPDIGAHANSMQSDLTMMALFLAMERSRLHWVALLKKVGLKIINIHTYQQASGESIITATLDD